MALRERERERENVNDMNFSGVGSLASTGFSFRLFKKIKKVGLVQINLA
jgi:hypothetical protein